MESSSTTSNRVVGLAGISASFRAARARFAGQTGNPISDQEYASSLHTAPVGGPDASADDSPDKARPPKA